jgi:reverse gyrase
MGAYGSPELSYITHNFKKCRRCSNEFFANAAVCPKCGKRTKNAVLSTVTKLFRLMFKTISIIIKIAVYIIVFLIIFVSLIRKFDGLFI